MGLSSKPPTQLNCSHNLLKNVSMEIPAEPVASSQPRNQQQQQQLRLKCPRCESTNTKFCYYNNYSRTQPRHFCKACKRHWTEGGTLRNVPVGGGRKNNKRTKPTPSPNNTNNIIANTSNPNITQFHHQQQQQQSDPNEFVNLMRLQSPVVHLSDQYGWLPVAQPQMQAQFGSPNFSTWGAAAAAAAAESRPIYTSANACSTTSASAWPGTNNVLDSSTTCDYWSAAGWDDGVINGFDVVDPGVRPSIADGSHSPCP